MSVGVLGLQLTRYDRRYSVMSNVARHQQSWIRGLRISACLLAEEKGIRKLNGRVPLNTNLCYSNKKAQERFAEGVISYIKTHPEADFVHIWLADDMNHMCECENCRDIAPSDHYVQLLNLIDEKMGEEHLDCHLVFLLYQELLYAPVKEQLKNHHS